MLSTKQAGEALDGIAAIWAQMFPVERYKLVHALIKQVFIYESEIKMVFQAEGIAGLLKEAGLDFSVDTSSSELEMDCVLTIPCKLHRYAGQVELQVAGTPDETARLPIHTALIQAQIFASMVGVFSIAEIFSSSSFSSDFAGILCIGHVRLARFSSTWQM